MRTSPSAESSKNLTATQTSLAQTLEVLNVYVISYSILIRISNGGFVTLVYYDSLERPSIYRLIIMCTIRNIIESQDPVSACLMRIRAPPLENMCRYIVKMTMSLL